MANRRRRYYFFIGIIVLVLIGLSWFIFSNSKELGVSPGFLLFLLVMAFVIKAVAENQIDKGSKAERRANRGAKAEEQIGDILSQLSSDFMILNDINSPYGNIDHIIISKLNGIFLIETKAHGGTVTMDGETLLVNKKLPEKNFISQVLQNSYWLRGEVGQIINAQPWITPVIVFTNAFVTPARPAKGVIVVNKKFLLNLLQRARGANSVNTLVWQQRDKISERFS